MTRFRRMNAGDQRGFSLIELLVVAAVLGLMVLMVDAFFATVNRSSHTVELAADIQQNARVAVERLSREAREAKVSEVTVCIPGPCGTGPGTMVVFPSARPATPYDLNFCLDADSVNGAGCVPPTGGYTGSFGPVRQAWVAYWLDTGGATGSSCASTTGSLYRAYLVQSTAPTSPPAVTDPSSAIVATCVSSFDASVEGTDRLVVTLVLRTTGRVAGTVVPPQQVTITSTTFMRN